MSAFSGAGRQPGVEVWRVEQSTAVKENQCNGRLHTGDCYLVLHTYNADGAKLLHNVHSWIGADSRQAEGDTVATLASELRALLSEGTKQFREAQGQESEAFVLAFGGPITYLQGSGAIGSHHADVIFESRQAGTSNLPADEQDRGQQPRLYELGNEGAEIVPVQLTRASLDTENIYGLVSGDRLLVWQGKSVKSKRRRTSTLAADKLLSTLELPASTPIVTIKEGSEAALFTQHFPDWDTYNGKRHEAATESSLLAGIETDVSDATSKERPERPSALQRPAASPAPPAPAPDRSVTKDQQTNGHMPLEAPAPLPASPQLKPSPPPSRVSAAAGLDNPVPVEEAQGAESTGAKDRPGKGGGAPPAGHENIAAHGGHGKGHTPEAGSSAAVSGTPAPQLAAVQTRASATAAPDAPGRASTPFGSARKVRRPSVTATPTAASNDAAVPEALRKLQERAARLAQGGEFVDPLERRRSSATSGAATPAAPAANGEGVFVPKPTVTNPSYKPRAREDLRLIPGRDTVSYAQLKGMREEDGLDMTQKEAYLADEEFEQVFGKPRAKFFAMPRWRQLQAKKVTGLF